MDEYKLIGKARFVMEAADIPGGRLVDDEAALNLGRAIERAATWRSRAAARADTHQATTHALNQIHEAASALEDALSSLAARDRIGQFWGEEIYPSVDDVHQWVAHLKAAAELARDVEPSSEVLINVYGSDHRLFVRALVSAYQAATGREAGTSNPTEEQREAGAKQMPGGPFVRFCQAAARACDLREPTGAQVKDALADRRGRRIWKQRQTGIRSQSKNEA